MKNDEGRSPHHSGPFVQAPPRSPGRSQLGSRDFGTVSGASPACASETKPQDCRPMHLAGFTGSARFHSPKSKINGG